MSGTQPFDIHELLRPEAFEHAAEDPKLIETHVSWVVLSGPFAYKIKKAIKLDFLDATDLAHRRFLCEEELRLNRRFAPELYLDVVAITRDRGRATVGGRGTPIEYAVKMRRFDPSDELSNLLPNQVTPAEIAELARTIAQFHANAAVAQWTGAPAKTRSAARIVLDNIASLRALLPARSSARRNIDSVAAWLKDFLNAHEPVFIARERSGFVREGHGDLHSRNVVRVGGRLVPFDCLEFDPDLRWIDVGADLAFLIMDLAYRERADLGFNCLSAYLEASGDYASLQLLAFHATHRALVRAKVDLISARGVPAQANAFMSSFEGRVRAAQSWCSPSTGMIVLMHGLSGSGKSWLSERLVTALPAVRVRSDVERKRLAGIASDASAASGIDGGIYSAAFDRRTYARLLECAEIGAKLGFTMIIDATFLDAARREPFLSLAQRLNVPCNIVACEAPPRVLEDRIAARQRSGDQTSDADLAVLREQIRTQSPFSDFERERLVRADTTRSDVVAAVAATLRERLSKAKT